MLDRISIQFDQTQTPDFFSALQARLNDPDVASLMSQRPVYHLEGATRYRFKVGFPHSIDVTIESQGLVEIESSASRHSGFDSPARETHFPSATQQDAAQASLLMDNASLRSAVTALVRIVIPEIDDATLLNGVITRIDIPINLSCAQEPLASLLSAAAASRPGLVLTPYGHGAIRNLAIKSGKKLELVLYDKVLEMGLGGSGLARLEFRIKGDHAVSEQLGRSSPWGGHDSLLVRNLDAQALYRALALYVHELVGSRREVVDVGTGNLDAKRVLEMIASAASSQGLLIDGMTVLEFAAHSTTPRKARPIASALTSLNRSRFDLDTILPRGSWNPLYTVPDVLAHLALTRPPVPVRPSPSEAQGEDIYA